MRRLDLLALAAVGVLVAGAAVYGQRGDGASTPAGPDLLALQSAAALEPCPTALGPDLPDLTLPCLGGGPGVHLTGRPAGPTLVNIWGSWCAPCVREVPDLVAFADKARGKVAVVGVLTTDTRTSALSFAKAYGMHYPNVVDDDGLVRSRYGGGTPLTLFLDADGTVTHVKAGEMKSLAEIELLVATHLGITV
ncbi:MAG: TlpA family protein disulfide reductase [Frankiales bacterium]|nr:TlpA family protein disulfide reductase [Frankiales bacterium]